MVEDTEKKAPAQLEELLRELVEEMRQAKTKEELEVLEKKVDIIEDLIEAYEGDRDLDKVAVLMDKLGPMVESIMGPLKELIEELYSPEKMQAMGKSVAEFYKNLVEAGMDKEDALELTKQYMESVNAAKTILETFQSFLTKKGGGIVIHTGKKPPTGEKEEGE
ncbi:hypothetical protein [Thermococcus sp.]|uniref:hypothetical protein n=1 Tax=Thermococcus sp. TaxID=35749 RepID=UPI00261349A8|nr:hypothetical protein [Thermococcus sp.]